MRVPGCPLFSRTFELDANATTRYYSSAIRNDSDNKPVSMTGNASEKQ